MSDQYFANNRKVGDGVTTVWDFSFAGARPDAGDGTKTYLEKSDVRVALVDFDEIGLETRTEIDFSLIGPSQVLIEPAVPDGQDFVIYRETQSSFVISDFVDFASISERDLDDAFRQGLFAVQELRDESSDTRRVSNEARRDTAAALDVITEITGGGEPLRELVRKSDLAAPVQSGQGALLVRGAVIYVNTITDLQELDTSKLVEGQAAVVTREGVKSGAYKWEGGVWSRINAALYQSDDIRDPELSGAIEDFQLFDMTAQEELAYQLSGQNPDASLPPLTGTILGECYFGFPTMDQTHKVASPFPRINRRGVKVADASVGGSQTIALSDIRAGTFNSSVNLPLFEPVMVDQYGIVAFRYLGEQPLHTVIRGGIQWLQRIHTGAVSTTAAIDAWLRLSPLPLVDRPSSGLEPSDNIPSWEAGGQARGRQYLGFCSASGAQHFPLIAEEWNDVPGQISPTVEAAIANDPELNTEPPINGWLSANSDDENVLDPDDPEGGTPPELEGNLKTTDWVDITPGTWYRGAVLPLGESSTRGRAQWRDSEGVIHYKNLGSGNFLFQAPPDAVEFRVYYAGPQDAHVTGLSIKSVTESQIRTQIVTRGTWRRYNINVCRDVVFYPNTVYRLELRVFGSHRQEGASAGYWYEYEDGYRIESGGLSFMFDASALVKQRAALHTDKGVN